jgi:hypothetical protein
MSAERTAAYQNGARILTNGGPEYADMWPLRVEHLPAKITSAGEVCMNVGRVVEFVRAGGWAASVWRALPGRAERRPARVRGSGQGTAPQLLPGEPEVSLTSRPVYPSCRIVGLGRASWC